MSPHNHFLSHFVVRVQVALDKLFRFATSRVLESEVAGKMCADMCAAAVRVKPAMGLKRFVPSCVTTIERLLEGER